MQQALIVFATLREAMPTLQLMDASEKIPSVLYECTLGRIVISGMGCLAASTAVARQGQTATQILNFGIVGGLNPAYALGHVCSVRSVMRNPILPEAIDSHSENIHRQTFQPLQLGEDGVTLVSSDYPIHLPELNRRLCACADIVDMEGYGIAFAARQLGVPCQMWKIVSDFATVGGPQLIQEQIDSLAVKLAQCVTKLQVS